MLKIYSLINIALISAVSSIIFLLINKSYKQIRNAPKSIMKHSKEIFIYIKSLFKFTNITDDRLNKSFNQNMQTLFSTLGSKDFKYKLPFVMIMGAEQSGKSALINSLQLEKTIDDLSEKNEFCEWSFFNEAILMEMHSSLFSSGNAYLSSDEVNWNKLLNLLAYHKPERPIDSLVITISMKDILDKSLNLTNIAEHYYVKIWKMQKQFKVNFPIYIVITYTDLIPGFSHFANSLNETMQQDIFGWSNPNSVNTIDSSNFIENAFNEIINRILILQQHLMVNHNISQDGLFVFPFELQKIKTKLIDFIHYIFKHNSLHDNFMLRGIYFTGSSRHNTYATHQFSKSMQSVEFGSIIEKSNINQAENILFSTTLFRDKIFKEKGMIMPLSNNILDNSLKVRILQYLSVTITLGGLYSFIHFYYKTQQINKELQANISQIRLSLHNVKITYKGIYDESDDVILRDQAIKLIEHSKNIKPNDLFSYFMPPSWFSTIRYDLKFMLGKAYNTVVTQFIVKKFNHELKCMIENNLSSKKFNPNYINPIKSNEFQQLHNYIEKAIKLENLYYKIKRISYLSNIEDMSYIMKNLLDIDVEKSLRMNKELFQDLMKYSTIHLIALDQHKKPIKINVKILFEQFVNNALTYKNSIPNIYKIEELLINIKNKQNYDITLLDSYFTKLINEFNKKNLLWIISRKLILGEKFNNMIYKIQDSHILGIKLSKKFKKQINNKIGLLRQNALTHRIPMIGVIFTKNEFGDLVFSKNFEEFQGILNVLARQEFMKTYKHKIDYQFKDNLVKWNVRKLAEITNIIDTFKTFSNHKILYQHEQASDIMSFIACNSTMKNIKYMLADSQSQFEDFNSEEALLSNISNNFKKASVYLSKILTFVKSKNPILFAEFKKSLQKQLITFLEKLNKLLDKKDLYNVAKTNFYLQKNINVDDVLEYLSKQSEQISHLAELATPAVQLLEKISNMDHKIYMPIFIKWKEISDAIINNAEGKANPIQSIETFIKSYTNDKKSCDYMLDSINQNSTNYFDKIRRNIIYAMSNKCLVNNYTVIKEQYKKISDYYNKNLAHKFPFNKNSNTEISLYQAKEFLTIWHEKEFSLGSLSTYLKKKYAWASFLNKIEKIIPWLEAMVNKNKESFLIKLRSNRDNEAYGNHIAIWKMAFGNKSIHMNMDFEEIPLGNYEIQNIIKLSKDSNYTFETGKTNILKYKGFFGIIRLINQFCINNCSNTKKLRIKLPLCDSNNLIVWFDIELKGNLNNWPDFPHHAPNFPKGDARLCFK